MRPWLLLAVALPACSDPPDTGNPHTLWIAPDGDERHVKLVDSEPPPW